MLIMKMNSAYSNSGFDFNCLQLETTSFQEEKKKFGPFRATQVWNDLVLHLREKVELKRRRLKMRHYNSCFTGADAVDVVLHFLLSEKDVFSEDLSRENAVKVCRLLMSKNVFKAVGSGRTTGDKHSFEDSSGRVYCFHADSGDDENVEPLTTTDDDDYDSLYDVSDPLSSSDTKRYTFPLHLPASEKLLAERSVSNFGSMPTSSSSGKCFDSSLCNMSTDTIFISKKAVQGVWREVALSSLTTLVDLPFLDGVLAEDGFSRRQRRRHNFIISNIVAKNWHLPITASLVDLRNCGTERYCPDDAVLRAAIACVECLPKGSVLLDERKLCHNDTRTKLHSFQIIGKHYSSVSDTILPEKFFDLHMAILNLILLNLNVKALEALRLDMVLLPVAVKEELHRLLMFMTTVALDDNLPLDQHESNEVVALLKFTPAIFRHRLLSPNLASVLVQFMMQNLQMMFTLPEGLADRVDRKVLHLRSGQTVPHSDTSYCQRISKEEYEEQCQTSTNQALVGMMNTVLDNTKMSLKEKMRRLKQFRKCYPVLYEEHFSGMV